MVSTIRIGARPRGIRLSPDGKKVFAALSSPMGQPQQAAENKIVDIDRANGRVAEHNAGSDPEQFAVHPDGTKLYVANEDAGTTTVLDLKTGKALATLRVGIEPEGVTISPSGRWVYCMAETSSTVSVIDTEKNEVVASFLVDPRPRDAAFSPDGARLCDGRDWWNSLYR